MYYLYLVLFIAVACSDAKHPDHEGLNGYRMQALTLDLFYFFVATASSSEKMNHGRTLVKH